MGHQGQNLGRERGYGDLQGHRDRTGVGVMGTSRTAATGYVSWLQGWSVIPCPCLQVRRAIQQMLFQGKDFSWIRHIAIAVILLTFINLLVIFAPSILGIFGLIGGWQHPGPVPP